MTADNAPTAASELLTLEETAALLRTPAATLRYWRHLGTGPDGFRLGRRVLYRREDVDRWVAERQQAELRHRPSGAPGHKPAL
ncbi:DNA-binding protein [Blastococcus sp. CT_GayMR20]|uniref:helix-turn-helix transcriptional regulator n=1 Tax=Blastococcus sp. CT_GayMR20 TaxID=2559609 RepID=UPI0010737FFF|nr:helix-turn-helix domain-containing protein [Blastococcus sp. CT_GayMR20]TFV92986.1 DNA-binding protein [Blastococcus sp. CT_GayMR20]